MTSSSLYTVHTTLRAGLAGGGRDEVRGAVFASTNISCVVPITSAD
jgi:hypothetical protein